MARSRKILAFFLLIIFVAGMFAGCTAKEAKTFQSMEDFKGAKIGVMTGSTFDLLAEEHIPNAEKLRHINISDLILNLKQGKIDSILMDKGFFTPLAWEDSSLAYVPMDMPATEYAIAFPKTAESEPLKNQMNEFIRTHTENGWFAELDTKWFSDSEPGEQPDFSQLTGENGTLRVATTVESKPFDYLQDGQFFGYDADFIFRFAEEYGYALEIDTMDFSALLASIAAERYDLAISSITVTNERKESVLFSDTYYRSPIVMVVASDAIAENAWSTLTDLDNATLGIVTGSSWDLVVQEQFPNAQRMYFNANTDALLALEQGKIDAFFADQTVYTGLNWESASIACINEPISHVSTGMILPKEDYNAVLLEQLNEFIALSKTNGTLDMLSEKWFGDTEPEEHPDYTKLTGENGTIRVAVSDSAKPTTYQRGSMYTGYEVEFLTMFAEAYGYTLEIEGMAFEALIPTVASGKCDIGTCSITITPERAESVTFADSHFETCGVAIVRKQSVTNDSKLTLADFQHATIGILSGSSFDPLAKERFPNAERKYYSLVPDMILAVEQGKIDAYLSETTYLTAALWEGAQLKAVDEVVARTNAGYIFQKDGANAVVKEQLNDFIRNAQESGLLDELLNKWLSSTEPGEIFDSSTLTGENGTLKVAIAPDLKPLGYVKNGEVVGYEVEVLQHFAKEYGYQLEFITMTFDAILPGVVSGKYDIGAGGMTITEERAQSVDFSESYITVDVVMVVSAEDETAAQTGFWGDVKESFEKTFIREDRWKLIVEGIGVTMLISICSVIAGTLLGFGLYMLSRSDVKLLQALAKGIAKVYSRIIAGTPVVVILMILFYVVFGKIRDMSGVVVAIIGFTLTFGAFVYDHMTVSVSSVDYGQTEAAYALGYPKNKTFFRIIFPQAMTIFLPSYCGQAVEVIKATAVVGYIAVNDLTKMGDIIRSNTYEAFFPLIATAVIYFLLTWALAALLGLLKARFEPKRRSKKAILKGVKTV